MDNREVARELVKVAKALVAKDGNNIVEIRKDLSVAYSLLEKSMEKLNDTLKGVGYQLGDEWTDFEKNLKDIASALNEVGGDFEIVIDDLEKLK